MAPPTCQALHCLLGSKGSDRVLETQRASDGRRAFSAKGRAGAKVGSVGFQMSGAGADCGELVLRPGQMKGLRMPGHTESPLSALLPPQHS